MKWLLQRKKEKKKCNIDFFFFPQHRIFFFFLLCSYYFSLTKNTWDYIYISMNVVSEKSWLAIPGTMHFSRTYLECISCPGGNSSPWWDLFRLALVPGVGPVAHFKCCVIEPFGIPASRLCEVYIGIYIYIYLQAWCRNVGVDEHYIMTQLSFSLWCSL